MRRIACLALLLLAACASSQPANGADAGADLSVSQCDPKTLFSSCSQQCGGPVCIVARASCAGGQWVCDCTMTGPCATDMAGRD